jgi:hypothetical protein
MLVSEEQAEAWWKTVALAVEDLPRPMTPLGYYAGRRHFRAPNIIPIEKYQNVDTRAAIIARLTGPRS